MGGEVVHDTVLGVGAGAVGTAGGEVGVGVAHGDGVDAAVHHFDVVEVVAEDGGLGGAEVVAFEEGAEGEAFIDARGLDIDPVGAGEDDAAVGGGEAGEDGPQDVCGLRVVDGAFADGSIQDGVQIGELSAFGEVVADVGEVFWHFVVDKGAGFAAEDGGSAWDV